jgi:hypothetical protein
MNTPEYGRSLNSDQTEAVRGIHVYVTEDRRYLCVSQADRNNPATQNVVLVPMPLVPAFSAAFVGTTVDSSAYIDVVEGLLCISGYKPAGAENAS